MDNVSDEVLEVARNLFNGGDIDYTIDRYGKATVDTDELPDLDSYEYAYGTTREDILKQALDLIIEILPNVKFYNDYNNTGLYIELSDNHTFWSINGPDGFDGEFDYDLYNFFVEQACDEFETKTGVELYQCGRSGRHICVDVNFDNVLNYDNLCKLQAELEQQVIGEAESNCFGQAMEEAKELAPDEKVAKCLSCGMKIKYKNRDVQHDAMGDYLECPNCKATFDIDYDNIEPLLNMKAEKVEEGKDDGIFTKQDVKSYLGDIARVVANVVRKSAKSASVGMPDDGELMNKNSVIVYELPIKFIGDVVGLGEEIAKELLAVLESGKIKDVKCVPTTIKKGTVLTLSIIGNNIVNSSKTIEPREGSKKTEAKDYSIFTPTNKVLSGDKGLSEKAIDEMRWSLPKNFKNMTDEQKQIWEEISLRDMVMSCLIYGEDIHTSIDRVSLDKYHGRPFVDEYYDKLGKDVTEEIIKQQTEYFKKGKVIHNTRN